MTLIRTTGGARGEQRWTPCDACFGDVKGVSSIAVPGCRGDGEPTGRWWHLAAEGDTAPALLCADSSHGLESARYVLTEQKGLYADGTPIPIHREPKAT